MNSNEQTALYVSPLYAGLTRPPMIMGVTLEYAGIMIICVMCLFILMDSPWYMLAYLPLHSIGWIACKFDQHIFSILHKRLCCLNVPNKHLWGCQSYEPY